jgi:hypothetical protein
MVGNGCERVSGEVTSTNFDPLVDLYGRWTTELAEEHLPIRGTLRVRYDCLDGYLIMSRSAPNSFAVLCMAKLLDRSVADSWHQVYATVNLKITASRWVQPDLTVFPRPIFGTWVPVEKAHVVCDIVSPFNRANDRIDRPAIYAEAGIPYHLYGQVDPERKFASVRLGKLVDGQYEPIAEAKVGERFEMSEPFRVSFDPIELLDL